MEITSIVPDDVLEEEILVRLSVKHLMRLKCVCKRWYALIRDYGFHKKHYHFQYARQDVIPLFLGAPSTYGYHIRYTKTKYYILSRREGVDVVLDLTDDLKRDITPEIANDPELPTLYLHCMGIVNGVVGLQWGEYYSPKHLALWNPATRDFKRLSGWPIVPDNGATREINPEAPGFEFCYKAEILGFDFDPHSDDFKILGRITFFEDGDIVIINECHLYSLKANSWKKLQQAPGFFLNVSYSNRDTYSKNGVYYWNAKWDNLEVNDDVILSFKFSTGIFKEFELPENVWRRTDRRTECIKLGKYKEGLALYVTHTLENTDANFEIWAATEFDDDDDHGGPSSWQLVFTVGPIHSFNGLILGAVRVCGDLLLGVQRGDSLEEEFSCLYDPSTCTFNFLEVGHFASCFTYVETMFSVSHII